MRPRGMTLWGAAPLAVVETGPGSVRLSGELDVAGVASTQAQLARSKGDMSVDCSELTFIDAAGIGMLVRLHRYYQSRGARLELVEPSPLLRRLLVLTGLETVLNVRR